MAEEKNYSMVFEYEPESFIIKLLKSVVIIALIGGALYGGYIAGLKNQKIDPEEVKELKSTINELKDFEQKYNELAAGQKGFVKIKEELQKTSKELGRLKEENEALSGSVKSLTDENAELKTDLEKYTNAAKELEEIRKENITTMEKLSKEVAQKDEDIGRLEQERREEAVAKEDVERRTKKAVAKMEYYKKQYARIVEKYDEVRDRYLEDHPEQIAIDWLESQIFTSPDGNYKILVEFLKPKGDFINFELGVLAVNRAFPKFTIMLYNEKGGKLKRSISVKHSKTGVSAGRVITKNQGWKVKGGDNPKYFEIQFE